jgi:nucleoid-associated protein YgaU
MGKVEKIVVLSVLFLIVVILAVSQSGWGSGEARAGERGDADVARKDKDQDAGERRADALSTPLAVDQPAGRSGEVPTQPAPRRGGAARDDAGQDPETAGLLSTVVRPEERRPGSGPVTPPAPALDPRWALVTLAGLQDTYDPAYKVYTCERDETLASVARALYGDEEFARLLRHANEGVTTLARGQRLLVPVQDDGLAGVRTYTVLPGESLWVIAKKHYGAGHRWNEIYEANRDVLKSPDAVREGDVLRIP